MIIPSVKTLSIHMMEDSNSKIKQKARKIQPSQVLTMRFLFFCFQEKATQEKISYQAKNKEEKLGKKEKVLRQ